MALIDTIKTQTAPGYKENYPTWIFESRALQRDLIGNCDQLDADTRAAFLQVQPYARELKETNYKNISHLVRFPYESNQAYAQRYALAIDGGESYRVLTEFIGHIMRPGYTLNLDGFSQDVQDKINKNIDGEGTDFVNFLADVIYEIAGRGRGFFLTCTSDRDLLPCTCAIPREEMRDCEKYGDELEYAIFDKCYDRLDGITRTEQHLRVLVTPDEWVYVNVKDNEIVDRQPNPLGFVPIVDAWFGKEGKSLVGNIARIQYLLLNSESVLAQKVRNQSISILTGPKGVREQLNTLSTNKVVEISPESRVSLAWAAYPATGLDGDFKYIQLLLDRMVNLSATRSHYDAAQQSGESKLWDFMTQRAVLENIANATETAVNQILAHWAAYTGTATTDKRFVLNRNYDARDLKSTLEIIFQAMSLQLGDTVEMKLKKSAREALSSVGVELTDEEKAQSDAELEDEAIEADNLEVLTQSILGNQQPAQGQPGQMPMGESDDTNMKTKMQALQNKYPESGE